MIYWVGNILNADHFHSPGEKTGQFLGSSGALLKQALYLLRLLASSVGHMLTITRPNGISNRQQLSKSVLDHWMVLSTTSERPLLMRCIKSSLIIFSFHLNWNVCILSIVLSYPWWSLVPEGLHNPPVAITRSIIILEIFSFCLRDHLQTLLH